MSTVDLLLQSDTLAIPEDLVSSDHWLIWQPIWSDEKNKFLKVPIQSQWQKSRNPYPSTIPPDHGVGFVFASTHNFICIDVDDGSPLNFRLVQQLNSYAEWSPSRKGAHVIVSTDNKPLLVNAFGQVSHNTQEKRDLFISSGYCTITGARLPVYHDTPIRHIPHQDLISILSPYFTVRTQQQQHKILSFPKQKAQPYSDSLVMATLQALPVKYLPDDAFHTFPVLDLENPEPPEARTPWLIVGQALHALDDGNMTHLNMWIIWSQQGDKYDKEALMASWRSFGTSTAEITFATVLKLFHAQRPQFPDLRGDPPKPLSTVGNVRAFIEFAKITGKHNVITNDIEFTLPSRYASMFPVPSVKAIATLVDSEMHILGTRTGSTKAIAQELLVSHAYNTPFNPVKDYFDNLEQWDYRSRLPDLLNTITFEPHQANQYQTYLRKWLIQVLAAVYTTPSKPNRVNSVLILQGDQGVGKTTWVESLFPPGLQQFCVGSKSINMSQFRNDMVKLNMELTNTLICNINEIDAVFNPRTYSEFKQFLDNTTDRVVLPYGASATTMLRRTVFIGSTNKYQIFSDHTGNRRFWLLNATKFDAKHRIDLNQLWSEIKQLYLSKEPWWLEEEQVLREQQKTNVQALNVTNEFLIDRLNNMFDPSLAPVISWETYTFPRLCTLLGLNLQPNSESFKMTKRTITYWLNMIAPNEEVVFQPKSYGIRWRCKMPPLRAE